MLSVELGHAPLYSNATQNNTQHSTFNIQKRWIEKKMG